MADEKDDLTKRKGGKLPSKGKSRTGNPSPKLYFHAGTQAALERFQITTDQAERTKLWNEDLSPAFTKLIENLINIYKFTSLESYNDLKTDALHFLFETIPKFDPTRGTNAFSYVNICCKNYLIIRAKQRTLSAKRSVSLDDPDALSLAEHHVIEERNVLPAQDAVLDAEDNRNEVLDMLQRLREEARTENELIAANSIITIFENIHEVDITSKSALNLYMKELSGLSPKQLTTAMAVLKKAYRRIRDESKDNVADT